MSGEEQQDQASEGVLLPVDLHVPDTMHKQYADNVIVQPGRHEITLFFFQTQIPPYTGPAEANKEYLLKKGSIRFECMSELVVAPQLVPDIIKALQTGLDNYNAAKAVEEREASK